MQYNYVSQNQYKYTVATAPSLFSSTSNGIEAINLNKGTYYLNGSDVISFANGNSSNHYTYSPSDSINIANVTECYNPTYSVNVIFHNPDVVKQEATCDITVNGNKQSYNFGNITSTQQTFEQKLYNQTQCVIEFTSNCNADIDVTIVSDSSTK